MPLTAAQKQTVIQCKKSCIFFLGNFCKIKHPSAGILPFKPFQYQRKALQSFRKHRFTIFKKCRQSGLSQISGMFALWFAMFHPHKTILIVSRTDVDARAFLKRNIVFTFDHLPKWMREAFKPTKNNEHEFELPNGSKIRSLTSAPDVLRSNASSLNIIDEAAFIPQMDQMWAAGSPSLMHGGSAIIISTVQGIGNWYWNTWMDASIGKNNFNPIEINWWDMDWKIEYPDALTGKMFKIEPTDGMRDCTTVDEINKYGPKWSPWLEDQWRDLQSRGESWKFKQEILAVFAGSGNTVVPAEILKDIGDKTSDDFKIVKGPHIYTPVTGEPVSVNFNGGDRELGTDEGLWVWKTPVIGKRPVYKNGVVVEPGEPAHNYAAGVDYATGKGADYQAMQVFDLDTMEQVAEIMIHCQPLVFKYLVDYIGRWYNNACCVVERNNGGDGFIDDLRYQLMYPNLWRKRDINDKPSQKSGSRVQLAQYGFMTTGASKNRLNKALLDFLQVGDGGMRIYSTRLHRQLQIYVRKRDRAGNETGRTEAETGPGNHDDLVMAAALGFIGLPDCMNSGGEGLVPVTNAGMDPSLGDNMSVLQQMSITRKDPGLMVPFMGFTDGDTQQSVEMALAKFTSQIGAIPLASELPLVSNKRHSY